MTEILQPVAKCIKETKSLQIYDAAFLIHSKYTVAILVASTCLVTAKQFFGEPIECFGERTASASFINSVCWTIGAYVMQNITDLEVAERVGNVDGERIYLRFYQWIAIYLLMLSVLFYLPAYLWNMWEGRRLEMLCEGAEVLVPRDGKYQLLRTNLLQYFLTGYQEAHFIYAAKYAICEALNFGCSIANILFLNIFLNGFWTKYLVALAAIPQYEWDTWNRVTSEIFPKVAKCEYKRFGPAAGIQVMDALCLLPQNIVNEKVFAFLWPWFIFVGLLAAFKLLYRLLLMCSKRLRLLLLRLQCRSLLKRDVRCVGDCLTYGDWFVLYKVSQNVNPLIYRTLVLDLNEQIRRAAILKRTQTFTV